jgi:hypothetical protein
VFRNPSSVSENITSELAETHTLTVRQHCCFNVQSTPAEKLVGQEVSDPEATIAAMPLLPKKNAVYEIRRLSEIWCLYPNKNFGFIKVSEIFDHFGGY